ncbi:hypothetical protein D3C80_976400 [compost metagenome]
MTMEPYRPDIPPSPNLLYQGAFYVCRAEYALTQTISHRLYHSVSDHVAGHRPHLDNSGGRLLKTLL